MFFNKFHQHKYAISHAHLLRFKVDQNQNKSTTLRYFSLGLVNIFTEMQQITKTKIFIFSPTNMLFVFAKLSAKIE